MCHFNHPHCFDFNKPRYLTLRYYQYNQEFKVSASQNHYEKQSKLENRLSNLQKGITMLDNFLGAVCQSLFMSSFLRIQNPSVSSRFLNLRITSWQYFLRISIHEISRQDTRRCYFKSRQHQRGKSHPRIHSFECFSRKVSSSVTHWNLSQITILETWTKSTRFSNINIWCLTRSVHPRGRKHPDCQPRRHRADSGSVARNIRQTDGHHGLRGSPSYPGNTNL